jgi:hypothetical protein
MTEIRLQLCYAQVCTGTWFLADSAEYNVNPLYDAATCSILQIQFVSRETATTYETSTRLHPKEQVMLTRVTFKFEVRDAKFQK